MVQAYYCSKSTSISSFHAEHLLVPCFLCLDLFHHGTVLITGVIHLFRHPFVQTFAMFFGSSLCFFTFLIVRSAAAKETQEKLSMPLTAFMVPVLLNFASNVMSCYALILSFVSTYQMLRSSLVLWTGIPSRFYRNVCCIIILFALGLKLYRIFAFL